MGVPVFGWMAKKLFGTRNQRMVGRYLSRVNEVNELEGQVRSLTDQEIRAKSQEFMKRFEEGATAEELMAEIFAVAREAMDRSVGIRNIFNPEMDFDPGVLSGAAREAYDQVKAEIDATAPADPQGPFLGCQEPIPSWRFVDIPPVLYDAVRELYPTSRPPFRARPFDVQIIGGTVLSEGRIAEMKTGEGKTIVAPLACYLACLQGKHVHVVTVNDYLVQRDRDWTFPFFHATGFTVGAIHPFHMQPAEIKRQMYDCNVVYGTTSEFGFDFLRDNMKLRAEEQVQKSHDFAIVDEVDSTLIDEARTPLIISGPAHSVRPRYELADQLARHLVEKQKDWTSADDQVQACMVEISGLEGDIRNARDKSRLPELKAELEGHRNRLPDLEAARDQHVQYYEVELDKKSASLTHEGVAEAQLKAGIGSFYVGDNIDLPHLLEQAVRAYVVYQADRDYVVAPDENGQMGVVIVDQNTGRKMVGRQWSDGLHQAVEAKEGVPIKDETQTMATITIQNYFKMYDRLAGMTGTADTEATEFHEIYRLDVVSIPTNVPVVRADRNDLVFLSEPDKWDSIVDEVKRFSDIGRPVLVGTTSVDKSEMLSQMLTRKHRIAHEVLNAKQHEREADIVLNAGQLGAVVIATNMAGRGTDIKLGRVSRESLIDHWKKRGVAPKEANASQSDEDVIASCWKHLAHKELGLNKGEVAEMDWEEARRRVLVKWAVDLAWLDPAKAEAMDVPSLEKVLDDCGSCTMHRLGFFESVNELGGLHIIGTERHESRRIDNQLRGRAGRQGDNGSSRFFLSLEDDLMKMFAGGKTLFLLSKLGMKEGDAIEHPMLSRSVEKAQRKVEERNFQIRKNILEYDEPMEFQRQRFYGLRQPVLEGNDVKETIFEYIDDVIHDEAATLLSPIHRARTISEWVREEFGVIIDPDRIRSKGKDREDLHALLRADYLEESSGIMQNAANEYLDDEMDRKDWDVAGFCRWAEEEYGAKLDDEYVRESSPRDVIREVEEAAERRFDKTDLTPLNRYLVPDYGARELVRWANNKFGSDFEETMLSDCSDSEVAAEQLLNSAREAYRRREIEYPVEFAMDLTTSSMQQNPNQALQQLCSWVRSRYELNWSPSALPSTDPVALKDLLFKQANKWDEERIAERARSAVEHAANAEELDAWFQSECRIALTDEEKAEAEGDLEGFTRKRIATLLRAEVAQFERWVLLQILDSGWKDHLHSMDQVRDTIGFRSISQKDPRIEFKRESARLFEEFEEKIRERTTDLVFKGKLSHQAARPAQPQAQAQTQAPRAQPPAAAAKPAPARSAVAAATAMLSKAEEVADAGTETQRRDLEIAEQAGSGGGSEAAGKPAARKPAQAKPTIGRNEIVTMVNPETGDTEQMKWKKAQPLLEKGWTLGG